MIRGLYTSGWSMLAIEKKMDIISNNMANAATNGYKKDTLVLESFPELMTKRLRISTACLPYPTILELCGIAAMWAKFSLTILRADQQDGK